MKENRLISAVCWAACALMLLSLLFFLSSPSVAERIELPDEQTVAGCELLDKYRLSDMEYQDPTIHVSAYATTYKKVKCTVTDIVVESPAQIRTAMSDNSYDSITYVRAVNLAKSVNAVAAVNGDFFKYIDYGLIIRQGVKYREKYSEKYPRDILLIDDCGDFYAVAQATQENIDSFFQNELPEGRTVKNTFTLGPILVREGQTVPIVTEEFQYRYPMQRVAVLQLDTLHYAIVECDGKADATYGLSMEKFAEFILSLYPDCKLAYNLDGGGSCNVMICGRRIHENPNTRQICDILYFASAWKE